MTITSFVKVGIDLNPFSSSLLPEEDGLSFLSEAYDES
jgi:hypothetical protein